MFLTAYHKIGRNRESVTRGSTNDTADGMSLKRIREHWQIENGLHWVLDIAFREDEARIRKDHAPQNMATLRHMALNRLKQATSVKVGIAAKRKMAGWDNTYLPKVLCPSVKV